MAHLSFNSLKQRLNQKAVSIHFMFDPLIKCDLFVKSLEMAERNRRKSSILQMVVKTLLLADDSTNHRVESTDEFLAGNQRLQQKKDFNGSFLVCVGEGKGRGGGKGAFLSSCALPLHKIWCLLLRSH